MAHATGLAAFVASGTSSAIDNSQNGKEDVRKYLQSSELSSEEALLCMSRKSALLQKTPGALYGSFSFRKKGEKGFRMQTVRQDNNSSHDGNYNVFDGCSMHLGQDIKELKPSSIIMRRWQSMSSGISSIQQGSAEPRFARPHCSLGH